MSDREKLIEWWEDAESAIYWSSNNRTFIENIADHLISSGVTFATDKNVGDKWIPVSERLPDVAVVKKNRYGNHTESVRVLCACEQESGKRMVKEGFCKVYANGIIYWSIPGTVDSVTHWMPLPEPPKECE